MYEGLTKSIGNMKNTIKILIVEDSEIIRESLQRAFSVLKGAEIIGFADNSMDAIDMYIELNPDIMILDLMLKTGTGFEVLETIKNRPQSDIVIVFSNHKNSFIIKTCIDLGADFFLDKSNDFDKLTHICKKIILDRISESSSNDDETNDYSKTNIKSKRRIKVIDSIYFPIKFILTNSKVY